MVGPLASMFEEAIEHVREREQSALQRLLDVHGGSVVLVGSGGLGRRALPLLTQLGATVLAYTDNNSAVWGNQIEGVRILSPAEAASAYGNSALFIVTIWNPGHWFNETYEQLTALGCTSVSTYAPLFWRFPHDFLKTFLLNNLPHCLYQDAQAVLEAEKLWGDSESLHIYRANIRWRAFGDASEMPPRPATSTYFPADLFVLNAADQLVDCGAFDGDTIRQAIAACPLGFRALHAIEADSISFERLRDFVAHLELPIRNRLHLYNCAMGAEPGFVRFESDGSLGARLSREGSLVKMSTIDQMFSQSPVTFLKMDIEGAESDAIRGAAAVLRRDRPILAICVYHTQSDIWRIPLTVREILPEHRFYLRAYEGDGFQTILYAVPPERQPAINDRAMATH